MFKVIGTGPQFPEPYVQDASSAREALVKRGAVEGLCGRATVQDFSGRNVTLMELQQIARAQDAADRQRLKNTFA